MIVDISRIKPAHQRFLKKLNKIVEDELKAVARDVQDRVIDDSSFNGNRLRHSIKFRKVRKYTVRIYTNVRHASYVEHGTRPHVIRARRKKALMFWSSGGLTLRKQVNHPGTKPTRFFSTANTLAFRAMQSRLNARLGRLRL